MLIEENNIVVNTIGLNTSSVKLQSLNTFYQQL